MSSDKFQSLMPMKIYDVFRPLVQNGMSPRSSKEEKVLFKKPYEYSNKEDNSDDDIEQDFNITHHSLQL